MRPSLRFLAIAVIGWAVLRMVTFGSLPGAELFRVETARATAPPIVPTEFPPIEPIAGAEPAAANGDASSLPLSDQGTPGPPILPFYYPAQVSVQTVSRPSSGMALRQLQYSPAPAPDDWPLLRPAAMSSPPRRSVVVYEQSTPAMPVPPIKPKLDRLQLSSWALLRSQQEGTSGSHSLASGGQLGASQAGARLIYNLDHRIALVARTSSEVGRRGGEIAGGVRVQPLLAVPVWITAERRQAIGHDGGGRNAFALFLEGGVYEQSLPWRLALDGYLQAGAVGMRGPDLFIDGGMTVTRPLFRQFAGGIGLWGGAQPHLARLDGGPRLTMRVRNNLRVHFDWRQRLIGKARPGSGPAVTLAGDF